MFDPRPWARAFVMRLFSAASVGLWSPSWQRPLRRGTSRTASLLQSEEHALKVLRSYDTPSCAKPIVLETDR